jgi:hypothetical protein
MKDKRERKKRGRIYVCFYIEGRRRANWSLDGEKEWRETAHKCAHVGV